MNKEPSSSNDLNEGEISLIIEAILFASTGAVCADWQPDDLSTLHNSALKLKRLLKTEPVLKNIYVFAEFVDHADEMALSGFEQNVATRKFDGEDSK